MANLSAYNLLTSIHDDACDFLAFVLNDLNNRANSHFSFSDPFEAAQIVREMAVSDPTTFAHYVGQYISDCVCKNMISGDVEEKEGRWRVVLNETLEHQAGGETDAEE